MVFLIDDECLIFEKFVSLFKNAVIDENIIVRAFAHLDDVQRNQLLDDNPITKQIGLGHLYEHAVYELIIDLIENEPDFLGIMEKGQRITETNQLKKDVMGVEHKQGQILIRSNNMNFIELDSILLDSNNYIYVIEIVNGSANLKGLPSDYEKKLTLMKKISGADIIPFVLISSKPISNKKAVQTLLSNPYTYFVNLNFRAYNNCSLDCIKALNHELPHSKKVKTIDDFPLAKVNYTDMYKMVRKKVYDILKDGILHSCSKPYWFFLDKISLGKISKFVLLSHLKDNDFKIFDSKEEHQIEILENLNFTHAILVFELRKMRGSIYIKIRDEKIFIKLGPRSNKLLETEKKISVRSGGQYGWLSNENELVQDCVLDNFLNSFFNNPDGERKNSMGAPKIKKLLDPDYKYRP